LCEDGRSAHASPLLSFRLEAYLRRRDNGEGGHHPVGELLANFGDQERTHAGSGSSSETVGDLELHARAKARQPHHPLPCPDKQTKTHSLQAIAAFGLLAHDIHDGVDQLGSLGVMSLGPVVSGGGLSEDKVVGAEELSEGRRANDLTSTSSSATVERKPVRNSSHPWFPARDRRGRRGARTCCRTPGRR
jgi:hypothetical protein